MAVKVDEADRAYRHPLYPVLEGPGLSVAVGSLDQLLTWGMAHSLWVFPMATSCCGIELMAAAAARVDLDRMGTIVRATPRQSDVMVVAGTITVKMAPRVRKLWDQMPEPKWCIAMGSCAISGDFYRNLYPVVPGIDTVLPVDVYIPGCPPNPEALMEGLLELKERVQRGRAGQAQERPARPSPDPKRVTDPDRDPAITDAQTEAARRPGDTAGAFRAYPIAGRSPEADGAPAESASPEDANGPLAAAASSTPEGTFAELLRRELGIEAVPPDAPPLVAPDRHLGLARAAKQAGFTLFGYVVASHWPAAPAKPPAPGADGKAQAPAEAPRDEVEIAYGLRRPGPGAEVGSWRLRVDAEAEVDSLCALFAGADWQEREQFDLVGVRFRGHPDLRRLLLPEAWQGHPLRRDYPADKPHPPWR